MNIIFLHSSADLYGSDKSLLRTITIFSRQNHKCTVLLPYNGPLAAELKKVGCEVEIWKLAVIRRQFFNPIDAIRLVRDFIISELRLSLLIQRKEIDIIHINTTAVLNGKVVGWLLGCRVLQHVREITLKPYILGKTMAIFIKLFSTKVIAVSASVKEHLNGVSGINKMKVVIIPNGIDIDKYACSSINREAFRKKLNIDKNCIVIGSVGRIHFWKGQDYLISIASKLSSLNKNFKLIIVGDAFPGYEYLVDDLKLKIEHLYLHKHVLYIGFIEDIPGIMKIFDIFILPSILPDPLPTVVLESMAARLPVVATAHGGALEMVIDGKTGFLVPWDNPEIVATKLFELITDGTMRKEMGLKGFKHLSNRYCLAKYRENIQKLFLS